MEMTSKCLKLWGATIPLWLVVSYAFCSFWRHFWGRWEHRPWLVPRCLCARREQAVIAQGVLPSRENDLRERIPHTWPSFHESCLQSILGSVSYCVVILRTPPYWSVRVASCNFELGGWFILLLITHRKRYDVQTCYSAVASVRPTEAFASVKFWRISSIIFILHKRSSDIFNASWYYKEFSNSVNIRWKNYHIIDLKGLRTLTQIVFEQILIKTIGEVNGHPDYVACFWLSLFKFHLN